MSSLSDVRGGLKTRLESISGLRVYDYEPEGALEYPCLVIEVTGALDYRLALGGNSFQTVIIGTLYLQHGSDEEGWKELDEYRSPVGTKSIKAAIRADRTLGGNTDTSDVILSDQVTRDRNGQGYHNELSARFHIQVVRRES